MSKKFTGLTAVLMMLVLASAALAADAVQLKLKDGSTWRGNINDTIEMRFMEHSVEQSLHCRLVQVADLYVKVEAMITGQLRQKTVFRADIVAIKKADGSGAALPASTDVKPAGTTGAATPASASDTKTSSGQCVFVLPLDGGVGETFRHEEIEMIGKEADKAGPGQIIILVINSNGGSAYESQLIGQVIEDIKKRHRVIAWVHKAISAGCQTAMCCDEIYFMTEGTAGSVTTWDGRGTSIKGEELEKSMEALAQIAEASGHSKFIAYAMKTNKALLSYDKDPVSGKVTFYGDLSGQYVLSDANSNLCFTASNALHCGFSDGTADTEEDLAKLLNLPKWCEVNDYGRRIAKQWQHTVEEAQEQVPLLIQRLNYKGGGSGDPIEVLSTRINIMQDLLKWNQRCPQVAAFDRQAMERDLADLRKQLADAKKRATGP